MNDLLFGAAAHAHVRRQQKQSSASDDRALTGSESHLNIRAHNWDLISGLAPADDWQRLAMKLTCARRVGQRETYVAALVIQEAAELWGD